MGGLLKVDKYLGMRRAEVRLTNNLTASQEWTCDEQASEAAIVGDVVYFESANDYPKTPEPLYHVREDYAYKTREDYAAKTREDYVHKRGDSDVVVYRSGRKGRSGYFVGLFVRAVVATVLFLAVFGMSKIDLPFFKKATEAVKTAITYDMDKSKDKELGQIPVVSKIEQLIGEQDDQ